MEEGRLSIPRVAPSRVRGLKHSVASLNRELHIVAPSRVRGLKHVGVREPLGLRTCRTLTGAWIEAVYPSSASLNSPVAPSRVRGL